MLKSFISLLFISLVFSSDINTNKTSNLKEDESVFKQFLEFVHKYDKKYKTMEEFQHRYNIFKNSLHRLSATPTQGSARYGITQFSDWTREEFKAMLKLKVSTDACIKKLKFLNDAKYPDSLDYRAMGKVSPVKNQYTCGSCWAFAVTGFIESQVLMKNEEPQTFSEQQLVDCDTEVDQGCNGGLQEFAFNYIQDKGIMPDMYYTYLGIEDECRYNKDLTTKKVKNVFCQENATTEEIKQYLAEIGPLSIALDANSMQDYEGGVHDCPGSELNHAVLLVGYGTEDGKDYWLIKNCWGTKWADQGYIKINQEPGKNCAVGIYVTYAELA